MASVPGPHRDTPADQLLDPARQMRWRVPELALLLSDRAVALARSEGDRSGRLQAEVLALFALNRLGRGVAATGRAIAAVREAEAAGDGCAPELRVELAWCARSSGSQDVAARVLRPVLEQERVDPVLRAHALVAFASVTTTASARSTCAEALDEAERLYSACELNRDTVRLLRARGRVARAAHHRRFGEFLETAQVAADGLDLLRQLGDPVAESGEVQARLVLEQVQALIELGRAHEIAAVTDPVLNRPVRAAAAEPVGWLGLTVANRMYLPEGDRTEAIRVLNDTVAVAERHRLDGLLAETLNTLSHALEQGLEYEPALHALRGAYSADRRRRSAVHEARTRLLAEFPAGAGVRSSSAEPAAEPARSVQQVNPGSAAPSGALPESPLAESPSSERAVPSGVPAADGAATAETAPVQKAPAQQATVDSVGATGLPELPDAQALHAADDVRDAARRLMDTLTGRTQQDRSARHPQAMPQPREPQDLDDPEPRIPEPSSERHDAADVVFGDDDLPDYDSWDVHLDPTSGNAADPEPAIPASAPDPASSAPASALPAEHDADPGQVEPERLDEPELLDTDRDGPDEQHHGASGAHEVARQEDDRLSSGRSLAEIQAALQVYEQSGAGRRRARHTEPGGPHDRSTPAAEVLAKHHDEWAGPTDQAPVPAGADVSEQPTVPVAAQDRSTEDSAAKDSAVEELFGPDPYVLSHPIPGGAPTRPKRPAEDEPDVHGPAADATAGEDRAAGEDRTADETQSAGDTWAAHEDGAAPAESGGESGRVGLADLLTEALMAYESGRRSSGQHEAEQLEAGEPETGKPEAGELEAGEPETAQPEPVGRHGTTAKHATSAQQGSEPDPTPAGRHSRPAIGNPAGSSTATATAGSFGGSSTPRSRHGAAAEAPGRGAGARHRHVAFESDPPAETSG